MKREIKFRAFDDGKMIYENNILHLKNEDNLVLKLAKFWCNIRNDSHVMQFTGLYDKNGKEIYEGDILKLANHKTIVVSFMYGKFIGVRKNGTKSLTSLYWNYAVIIGNIHEPNIQTP